MLPSVDSSTAIQRVESNWAQMMYSATNNGTLKNMPAMPQIIPHTTKFIKIANVDRFNVLPVSFGSIMLPNKICKPIRPIAVKIGCCNVGADASEYNIGRPHAINAPMVGM